MTDEIALSVEGAAHGFTPGRTLFRDLSFSVRRGRITALLGGNGCGKTTLLRALVGLETLNHGTIRRQGPIAFVPQSSVPTFPYAVLEIVVMGRAGRIGLFAAPTDADYAHARIAMERLRIAHLADHGFDTLSGGERQLVLIARALAGEGELLVLDEPAAALDFHHQDHVLTVLQELAAAGTAILFSTHAPQHVLAIAHDAVLLGDAEHHWSGPVGAVMQPDILRALYGVEVALVTLDRQGGSLTVAVPIFASQVRRKGSA